MLLSKVFALMLSLVLVAALLGSAIAPTTTKAQEGVSAPEITEPECSFSLDRDEDGEGSERFDAEPEEYVPQRTPVVGGCTFKLHAPVEATIVLESELRDWKADVEIKKEPGDPTDHKLYRGDNEIPGITGRMVVTASLSGGTRPSIKSRELPDGYRHDVQIPEEFRLLEIEVVTADGSNDRLERNVQSASAAYIQVYRLLATEQAEMPEWAANLARQWLNEGYPQVADSIIVKSSAGGGGAGGTNWWMWAAIITWALIVALGLLFTLLYLRNR